MYTNLSIGSQLRRIFNNEANTTTTGIAGTPLIDTCYRNERPGRGQTNKESGRRNWRQIKPAASHSTSARNQKNFRPEFRVSRFTGDWHWPRSYAGRRTLRPPLSAHEVSPRRRPGLSTSKQGFATTTTTTTTHSQSQGTAFVRVSFTTSLSFFYARTLRSSFRFQRIPTEFRCTYERGILLMAFDKLRLRVYLWIEIIFRYWNESKR